jgi:predicted acyl esterase
MRRAMVAVVVLACGLVATGCEKRTTPAPWAVRPGVEQVTITGAQPHEPLTLWSANGHGKPKRKLLTLKADDHGQASFAYVPSNYLELQSGPGLDLSQFGDLDHVTVVEPGRYVVRDEATNPVLTTTTFQVLGRDDHPDPALYDRQVLTVATPDIVGAPKPGTTLAAGFNYLEMRDGVLLSAMVRLPDAAFYGPGPYPTVIEYSGYGPSNPDAEEPSIRLARAAGYATVAVNMRGSGCSGGVFDVFNPAQMADGYDAVEIVARQPWVQGHKVGMVGISYSGISQLYVAATRPPSLAAITPLSVIADPWVEQYPGGIYNDGFTKQWLAGRDRESSPSGTNWVRRRIDGGDQTCAAHQVLRNQNPDFEAVGRSLRFYRPIAEPRDLRRLVRDIDVPVMIAGAFQDEQTGPQFTSMLDQFTSAPALKVALWNGRHPDGLGPVNAIRWFEFLEFNLAGRVPRLNSVVRAFLPAILAQTFELQDTALEPDRWYDRYGDDFAAAKAAYDAEPSVRVVYESGIGANELGEPGGTFEQSFPSWPAPSAVPTRWYLGGSSSLRAAAGSASGPADRATGGVDSFRFDPAAGQQRLFPNGDYPLFGRLWEQANWTQFPAGDSLSYLTDPLTDDLVVAGPGYADLWVASDAPAGTDVDVQVTVSEVRPDGVEYLVQNGWLRLGDRKVDPARSTDLEIVHPFTERAYRPPEPGRFVEAKVEIPSLAHVFHAGSQLRLTLATPGRNHVTWAFEPPEYGGAVPTHQVAHTRAKPSSLVLAVLPGVTAPPHAPAPCPSLRGMACRPYVPTANTVVPGS